MTVVAERLITAEEFLVMPGVGKVDELVRGRVLEVTPSGVLHSRVAARICGRLDDYGFRTGAGFCTTEQCGYVLSRNPDTVRCPDIGYVVSERYRDDASGRFMDGAPDLAVEVMSPSQSTADVERKVGEYLEAGSRLVWVVYPEERAARVWRADGSTEWVAGDAALSGEDVLPGFTLPLVEVFP